MKTNKINEKRYEKGASGALSVSFLNDGRMADGQRTDIGRTSDGHRTDIGRTSDGHVTDMCATSIEYESNMNRTSIEHQSNMNGRRMGDEWEMNGTSMGEMKFAKFATSYFARVAAMLLMLVTMSVGQVWGAIFTFPDKQVTFPMASDGVTLNVTNENKQVGYVQFGSTSTFVISSSSTITAITITYTDQSYSPSRSNNPCTLAASVGSFNSRATTTTSTWSGSASSITFTCGGSNSLRISSIVVTTSGGSTKTLYLVPNSNWKQNGNEKFAVYSITSSSFVSYMTEVPCASGVYQADIPSSCAKVIFCRMNPSGSLNWDGKWNQTGDLTIPDGKDCFTVPNGAWDGSTTTWSTYSAPSFSVTYKANGGTGADVVEGGIACDGSHTVKAANTFSRTNWSFLKWNDGGGIAHAPASTIDNITSNITLWAHWYARSVYGELTTQGNWEDHYMTDNSVVIHLPAGVTRYFGYKYYQTDVSAAFYADKTAFTTTGESGALTGNTGNMSITTTIEGDYTFTFNPSTNKLSVTYPAPAVVPVTGITVVASSYDIKQGETATITATIAPANATDKSITWSSPLNSSSQPYFTFDNVNGNPATFTTKMPTGGQDITCTAVNGVNGKTPSKIRVYRLVEFESNGGSACEAKRYYNANIELPSPTKSGFDFAGWYSDSKLNTKVGDAGASYKPNNNVTLYAKWTAAAVEPTITFNNGNYTIGGAALDLSTLFSSNSGGAVTYTVTNANGTGAAIAGTSFTATTAGTATVQAAQAAAAGYTAKNVTATITVADAGACVGVVTYDISCWNTGNIETLTTKDGLTIVGTAEKNVTIINSEEEISGKLFTKCAKLGGTANASYRYVSFAVSGSCTIDVYLTSAKPGTNRTLNMYSGSWGAGDVINGFAASGSSKTKESFNYTGSAATLVLGSVSDGINIYGIDIRPYSPTTYTVTANDPATSCDRVVNDVREGQEVVITNSCSVPGKHLTGYTPNTVPNYSFDAETKTLTFNMPASNVTLTAVWVDDAVETYTVTFDANGATSGTAPAAMAGNVMNQEINLPTNSGSLAKTGYTFSGWNTRADGSGTSYAVNAPYTVTENVTLFAKWTEDLTTVWKLHIWVDSSLGWREYDFVKAAGQSTGSVASYSIDLNGGEHDFELIKNGSTYYKNSGTMNSGNCTNWTFTTSANRGKINCNVTGNYTFTINFAESNPKVTVTYPATYSGIDVHRSNSNAADPAAISAHIVAQGQSVTVTAQAAKAGYVWAGWTSENGTFGDAGALVTTFTPTANSAIAQANYTANTYSVAFNANGGAGSMENQAFTYGEAAKALTSNSFTRTGFTFAGWNTAADGAGTNYTDGQSVQNLTTEADETVTLYAKWTANNPGVVTVTGDYHHFVGETMTLTATAANTLAATGVTYTWKKGSEVVAGQTTATLSIPSCTFDNAGNYTCTIDNNGASATSAAYGVKILKFLLKDNSGNELSGHTFTKVDENTATVAVYMNEGSTYKWSMIDGVGGNYGNSGTMTEGNCENWTLDCNCNTTISTVNSGDYIFTLDYSNMPTYKMSVRYPDPNQLGGNKVYFDNSVTNWSESSIYYRIGRDNHVNAVQLMTKVAGTANLYETTTPVYNNFLAWHVANAAGNSNTDKSVYDTKTISIGESSTYQKGAVTAAGVTICPALPKVTGERTENNNCDFYGGSRYNGLLTHTATVGAHVGGTLKFTYTDIDGVEHADVTETTAGLAHTCILTITAEASTGYTLSGVTVNGNAYTIDDPYVLSEDATIEAVITANQYNITYKDQGDVTFSGTGWETTHPTIHTYGTATTLVNPTKASSLFLGWYETPDCLGAPVTTIGATSITADKTLYAKWADYCFAMVVNVPTLKDESTDLTVGKNLSMLTGGSVDHSGIDNNTKNHGLRFGSKNDYIAVTLGNDMQLGKNTRILVSFETTNAAQNGITFGTETTRPTVDDSNSILTDAVGTYILEEFVVSKESPLFEATTFYIYRAGGNGTYLTAVYVVDCSKICHDQAPKIVEVSHDTGCSPNYVVKAVGQSGNDLLSGSFQWYKDEVAIGGATSQSYTITADGSYTVEYTNTCPVFSSNSFEVEHLNPSVQKLVPFQYYHADSTYVVGDARHLFTFNSAQYQVSAIKNVDIPYAIPSGAVYRKAGTDGVDTLMLNRKLLNNLAVGDSLTITATPKDACGNTYPENAASVKIYAISKTTKTLAFILPGANSPTKYKQYFVLDGDFLTGYNKADLFLQNDTANSKNRNSGVLCYDPDTELPLYTDLKANFLVTPVNGYAKFNIFNYEPFDLLFLTDFVKSDGTADKAAAKKRVEELGLLVDYRPMFSTKGHMSGFNNWKDKGFTANPVEPKQTQLHMNIVCYAHPMFEDMSPDGDGFYYDALDHNETVFQMLSQGGYDSNKGIQGFEMTGANEFIKISLTHYDAHGDVRGNEIAPIPGANDRTLIASCERQENINARFMILSLNADATCFLTARGREVIIRSLKYLLETNPVKVTDCHFEFDDANHTGIWNDPANWAPNHNLLPSKNVDVRIKANCVVDTTTAMAANVKIKNGVTLTIAENGALQIQGIAQHQDAEGNLIPTSENDLLIRSGVSGNGAFIHGDTKGQTGATVEFYSKANGAQGTDDDTPNWQWMTTPFGDNASALKNYYNSWMTAWSNTNHEWSPVIRNDDPVHAFAAYCYTQAEAGTRMMTGTLASTANQTFSLNYGGNSGKLALNLFGNSWTAPINISGFDAEKDFTNAYAVITMLNTGYDPNGTGDNHDFTAETTEDVTAPGEYVSIPVSVASHLPKSLQVIPSMQAFQIEAMGSGAKFTMDYDRLVRTDSVTIRPMRAPGRGVKAYSDEDPIIDEMRISVVGTRHYDVVYLFQNEDCSAGFENGWDAYKNWSANFDIPQLFVENADGDWSTSTQDVLVGTQFGFYRGEDSQYTMFFHYDGDETYYLYDSKTGTYTLVRSGNTYTFQSNTFNLERRFVLTNQAPGIATDAKNIDSGGGDRPRKLILDDKLFILNQGRLYDATGRLAY